MKQQLFTVHTMSQTGALDSEVKSLDWYDKSDRTFLDKHIMWAIHNNRTVTLSPKNS